MIRAAVFTVLLAFDLLHRGVLADQPFVRYNSGCQLLMNDTRIYCFSGGYAKVVNLEITPLADHYYLDISNDFVVANSYNTWTRVLDPPNFVSEATTAYVSVKLSDTRMLINGGTGINNGKALMKNQTVIYHADTNQWETVSNVSSIAQSYYGSGALAADNTVVFWGGAATIGELVPTFNGTAKLLFNQQITKWSLQPTAVAPGYSRYGHTATADQTGKLIYYLGGRDIIRDPNTAVYTRPYTLFTNVLIYHTDTSVWEKKTISSSAPPSGRMSHTATLLPNTGEILIYGGAGPDSVGNRIPMSDYIHIYNPAQNTIQPITIASDNKGAGPRFGHSAVLKNNALFILFGIDNTKLATNDFHVLNTQTYQWMTSYSAGSNDANSANNPNGANGANNSGTNPINDGANNAAQAKDGGTGLSSGAIAGICVGVIGAIAIIIAFLFIRRKKQKKADEDTYPSYWDVTSINNGNKEQDVQAIPITSTGPVDITKVPGYARTNLVNDKDVNPPKAFLSGDTTLMATDQSIAGDSTGTYVSSKDQDKSWPPDVYQPSVVTPSSPNELIKPDISEIKK